MAPGDAANARPIARDLVFGRFGAATVSGPGAGRLAFHRVPRSPARDGGPQSGPWKSASSCRRNRRAPPRRDLHIDSPAWTRVHLHNHTGCTCGGREYDLYRFAVALQSGRLLSKASLQRLWADPDRNNYGAGFENGQGAVGSVVGHSGLFYGVSTRMRIYRTSGYVVVVLANMDRAAPPLVDAIEGQIIRTRAATLAAR